MTLTKVEPKQEITNFLKEKQFFEWKKLLGIYIDKITENSIDKEEKKFWVLKLYSLYIQFIEVFSINLFIITENNLFDNLFLPNDKLKQKIEQQLGSDVFIDHLCKKWIFGVSKPENISNLADKESLYQTLIKEVVKDYVSDQELLNAYKHGFRLESKGQMSLKISRGGESGQTFSVGDYNSSVFYWSRGRGSEKDVIFENRLLFNWERVQQKFTLLDNILENVVNIFSSFGKKVNLTHLYIEDRKEFNKPFGTLRMRQPIFTKSPDKSVSFDKWILID